jgi:molecular chaperone DnaK (HSP70)
VLSNAQNVSIYVDCFYLGIDLIINISRIKFEYICKDIFNQCIVPIDKCIKCALKKDENINIDEIILVGGVSKTPKIREIIHNQFYNIKIHSDINPDEVVAQGAAIYAYQMINQSTTNAAGTIALLMDINPMDIGIKLNNDKFIKIIKKNTQLPCKNYKICSTVSDNQNAVHVQVYEDGNIYLGSFILKNISRMKKSHQKIKIKFSVDITGLLKISATELKTGKKNKLIVEKYK